MKPYVDTRIAAERRSRRPRSPATVVRPWYVLGPGHRWPLVLVPFYAPEAASVAKRLLTPNPAAFRERR